MGTSGLLRMKQGWACGQDTGEVCASLWPATLRAGPPKLPSILRSPGEQLETLAGRTPTPEGARPPPAGNRQDERSTSPPGPRKRRRRKRKKVTGSQKFSNNKNPPHGWEGSPYSAAPPSKEGPPQVIKATGSPPILVPTRRAQPVDPTPAICAPLILREVPREGRDAPTVTYNRVSHPASPQSTGASLKTERHTRSYEGAAAGGLRDGRGGVLGTPGVVPAEGEGSAPGTGPHSPAILR